MHLFIDTNVLLSFYHFSNEDLEELKKLLVLLDRKEVTLCLPQQVKSEFRRNREGKIADALKRLKDQRLNLQFPQICKDYPQYGKLRDLQKEYDAQHTALLNSLSEDIAAKKLKADEIIEQLFQRSMAIPRSDAVLEKARLRMELGNPPGKSDSMGDAINWEALLETVPEKTDLYFISGDKDYRSALDDERFNDYLSLEWIAKRKSSLVFYQRISAFFQDRFPDIKVATELEKDLLIKDLKASGSFATTHSTIGKLSKFCDFTSAQLNAIADAVITNSQVRMIASDADVSEFLSSLIEGHKEQLDAFNLELLQLLIEPDEDEPSEDDRVEPPWL